MARFIELRRHTDNEGDVLTDEGVREAVELGALLIGVYSVVYSSGAQRATQTAGCILAGLRDAVANGVRVETRLRSAVEDRWRAAAKAAGSSDLNAIRFQDPALVEEDSARLADGLRAIFGGLGHGEMALAVGHSPTNEAAVYGLTGQTIEPLAKGGGVMVVEDAGGFRVEELR